VNKRRPEAVEINSDQLDNRLTKIEDRVGGVEALLAHVHRGEIESLISDAVGQSEHKKRILQLCETPQTIPALQAVLGLNSKQALNNHLAPLKDHGLLQHGATVPEVTYEWSPMIRRLSKIVRDRLLK
jgi:hypothetical protein